MSVINIVISGGGLVGSFLANNLSEKHAVVVIEKKPERCERLAASMRAMVINGDACDLHVQKEARVEMADVFAAVTGDDDDNLVACQLAKTSFDVPRTVARVNNPKNERIFNLMGIDAISSTTVISRLIEEETTVGEIITLNVLKKGAMAIVEVDIPESGCNACGKAIKDMGMPRDCVLVSIIRGERVIIPHGGVAVEPGDSVIAVTSIENEAGLKKILTS